MGTPVPFLKSIYRWKEKTDPTKLSSDRHRCSALCCTHKIIINKRKKIVWIYAETDWEGPAGLLSWFDTRRNRLRSDCGWGVLRNHYKALYFLADICLPLWSQWSLWARKEENCGAAACRAGQLLSICEGGFLVLAVLRVPRALFVPPLALPSGSPPAVSTRSWQSDNCQSIVLSRLKKNTGKMPRERSRSAKDKYKPVLPPAGNLCS